MDLDDAYANAAYITNAEAYPPRWTQAAAAFRAGHGGELAVPYGESTRQAFDLFRPEGIARGVFVFVHGGYWLKFDRSYWSHLAGGALRHGWAVAMPSYDLAPTVRISRITQQVAQAVGRAAAMVDGPILLAGHSAGGHLVARMACTGGLPEQVARRLRHVVPISPVADLRPLMRTSMNADLRLDDEECLAESPVLLSPQEGVKTTVWVGGDERPAFLDQARWLSTAWGCDRMVAGGRHHFDVINALADAGSDLSRLLFAAQPG